MTDIENIKVYVTIRIPLKLKLKLEELARAEEKSLSSFVAEHLEKQFSEKQ